MGSKNSIKSTLLTLYKEGKTEDEAYNQIVESHSSKSVSKKTVNKWYQRFNSGDFSLDDSAKVTIKNELSDEYLTNLIKDNPNHTISELGELENIPYYIMRKMVNKLNSSDKEIYKFKNTKKVSDEFIIDLVNNNPKLSMRELAKLASVDASALSSRITMINRDGEKVNYVKKKPGAKPNEKPVQKFTDEYLIDLVNENPNLNMTELGELAGTSASNISKRIKQINRLSEKVSYRNKSIIKISDEHLIELVNQNPDLNMDELAKLAGTTNKTMSLRIRQLNSNGKSVNYVNKKILEFNSETYNKPGPRQKFTDEYLINLIKENPRLSKMELAKLAKVSYTTMLTRIKQVKINEKS